MNRVRRYTALERRWAAVTLLVASLLIAACMAVLVGAIWQNAWVAIAGGLLTVPLWKLMMWAGGRCAEWSERRHDEIRHLERETPFQL